MARNNPRRLLEPTWPLNFPGIVHLLRRHRAGRMGLARHPEARRVLLRRLLWDGVFNLLQLGELHVCGQLLRAWTYDIKHDSVLKFRFPYLCFLLCKRFP
jgi:hypothetical protein